MEQLVIENLSFYYPNTVSPALKNISLTVNRGEFITVCGSSGCGKTTLLRLIKPEIAPYGEIEGQIRSDGCNIRDIPRKEQKIGFVFQDPNAQTVTDKVWHEMAFTMESLGKSNDEIRRRVAETASFFGIHSWFRKSISELSGGQKQILNLASVMTAAPELLILDEPTAQLDPIAAQRFLNLLAKINRETDTTIILSEHRTENVFPVSDRVVLLENGGIKAVGKPKEMYLYFKNTRMEKALPAAAYIYANVPNKAQCPVTIRDGRKWLEDYAHDADIDASKVRGAVLRKESETAIELKEVYFRYGKQAPDVLSGLDAKIKRGEIYALMGGNGAGKTTSLLVMGGINRPYRGKVTVNGKTVFMMQDVGTLFVRNTLFEELQTVSDNEEEIKRVCAECGVGTFLDKNPFDLSGGEMQRAAMAKILLTDADIFLLDEPTKGMDAGCKEDFAIILKNLTQQNKTVVLVSHDIEFCAEYADRCAMFFDGKIVSAEEPSVFFGEKLFYTTAANRIARDIIPGALLCSDVINACGGSVNTPERKEEEILPKPPAAQKTKRRIIPGLIFSAMFVSVTALFGKYTDMRSYAVNLVQFILAGGAAACFIPQAMMGINIKSRKKAKLSGRTILCMISMLVLIAATLFAGTFVFGSRRFYAVSLAVLAEIFLLFAAVFEGRHPQTRELVLISVMCAAAVVGRAAFYMLPQFKCMTAIVIISGVCFGAQTGFLIGAVSAFVSNFFFGQGAWTPWQMFALGLIGLCSGIIFRRRRISKTELCIFGAAAVLLIYGPLMNTASVLIFQPEPTRQMLISAYALGLPFDIIHAVSTVFFLWVLSAPMIEKLERIKIKYGLLEEM